jgi:ribosomal protein S16
MDTYEVWSGAEQITLLNTDADNGDGMENPFTFTVGGTVSQPAHDLGTVGEYDPTKSIFYLRSSNQSGVADLSVLYGPARSGWTPLAGDWDGNGIDTVGLYDPVAARFYLRDSNTAGFADMMFDYGLANGGWIPLAGDWNGDGQETVGLYNPTTSAFYLKNSNTGGFADVSFVYGPAQGGWKPVGGDWDGDGVDTIGLYNPTTAVFYLRNSNTTGYAETAFNYGPNNSGWTPLIGDWDGDGIDSAALHDAATSTFYLRYSNDQGTANAAFDFDGARHTWLPVTGVWTVGNALLADELPATASADAAVLSRAELQPVIVEATARWTATGLDASSLAKLAQVQFIIADLPDLHLGTATANRVYVDINGAGHGWFVDPTPGQDEEFATAGVAGPLRAVDARALDRIDLLTVVEHELGHILGLADVDALAESVMQNVLAAGLRRQP